MRKRLKILLTNDDGYGSRGIKYLYDALSPHHEVIVVAPREEQSGIGHAFTFNKPIAFAPIPAEFGMNGYMISGTPSDCVKFAVSFLLPDKPDIVIAGINSGENSGISGFYSGTVAAAREGAFWRIPSFAFSLCTGGGDFFPGYSVMATDLLDTIIASAPPGNGHEVYYNVNFPPCSPDKCRGVRVTRQSMAFFDDRYRRIETGAAQEGFIIYGEKKDVEESDLFDSRALMNEYTTITPLCYDATAHWVLAGLSSLEH